MVFHAVWKTSDLMHWVIQGRRQISLSSGSGASSSLFRAAVSRPWSVASCACAWARPSRSCWSLVIIAPGGSSSAVMTAATRTHGSQTLAHSSLVQSNCASTASSRVMALSPLVVGTFPMSGRFGLTGALNEASEEGRVRHHRFVLSGLRWSTRPP